MFSHSQVMDSLAVICYNVINVILQVFHKMDYKSVNI